MGKIIPLVTECCGKNENGERCGSLGSLKEARKPTNSSLQTDFECCNGKNDGVGCGSSGNGQSIKLKVIENALLQMLQASLTSFVVLLY